MVRGAASSLALSGIQTEPPRRASMAPCVCLIVRWFSEGRGEMRNCGVVVVTHGSHARVVYCVYVCVVVQLFFWFIEIEIEV